MRKQRLGSSVFHHRSTAMKIRQSAMTVRKGFMFRLMCILMLCSLIIYAIHLYRKAYSVSSRKSYLISQLAEQFQNQRMAGSVAPGSIGDFSGSALMNEPQGSPVVTLQNKLVHFDLKGMPPTLDGFRSIFPFLKNLGVTGVLMEYEDMFPFHGKLASITNKAAYKPSEIEAILSLAKQNNLQVIPLIQTFGHLEFLLKLEEFSKLREVPKYPQVICPTNNQTLELINEMVDQVMALHPETQYLHIGSDEVYYIGMCPLCQERMNRFKIEVPDLFLHHVKQVATYVKDKHGVKPMMWDDEFRNLDEKVILQYEIGSLLEIVVWNYSPDVPNDLRPQIWLKYAKVFKSVWIGSAFKGANKPNSLSVNETLYLTNHYSWMDVIAEYKDRIEFKGIFITGWQRYDHFSVLCELFPAAIPSLVSCMFYLNSNGRPRMEKIFSMASIYLDCGSDMLFCQFPGSQIYSEVNALATLQINLKRIKEQNLFLGWTQSIQLKLQFSSPSHVETILAEITKLKVELQRLHSSLATALRTMFPEWSVQEWIETNYDPIANEVAILYESLENLSKIKTFPVRPLGYTSTPDSSNS